MRNVPPITIGFVVILSYGLSYSQLLSNYSPLSYPVTVIGLIKEKPANVIPTETSVLSPPVERLFFVGDVMLGRHVETLMNRHEITYPFLGVLPWSAAANSMVVANFEAPIPRRHSQTPDFGFMFSVSPLYLPAFKSAGFTHVSLANNHTLDHGRADLVHTRQVLEEHSLVAFGDPVELATTSVTYINLGSSSVAIMALNPLQTNYDRNDLNDLVTELSENSRIQIAFLHWGYEYITKPTAQQKDIAALLVELGFDLIVGHHPHVVQEVSVLNGVPIFYSLGNFIFDQYFSAAVQTGLVLELRQIEGNQFEVELWPVSSLGTPAQPSQLAAAERSEFLAGLAAFSDEAAVPHITSGLFTLIPALASSTEIVMMDSVNN